VQISTLAHNEGYPMKNREVKSATAFSKITKLATHLNQADIKELIRQLEEIAPYQPKPTPAEAMLPPGHHFEERSVQTGKASRKTYLYDRWYERQGGKLNHKGKCIFKGTLAEYIRQNGNGQ